MTVEPRPVEPLNYQTHPMTNGLSAKRLAIWAAVGLAATMLISAAARGVNYLEITQRRAPSLGPQLLIPLGMSLVLECILLGIALMTLATRRLRLLVHTIDMVILLQITGRALVMLLYVSERGFSTFQSMISSVLYLLGSLSQLVLFLIVIRLLLTRVEDGRDWVDHTH